MEPMTLGSAPGSPASPTANPNFLPSFLLGDTQPAQASTPNPSHSPGRNRTSGCYRVGLPVASPEPRTLTQKLFQEPNEDSTFASPYMTKSDKPGPPKQGLFDSAGMNVGGMNNSALYNDSFNESVVDGASSIGDSLWVTVFGFTPANFSTVLGHFANLGHILDRKSPAQGNWVHLKYSSFDEVTKALQFNGKIIVSGIMVGVCPYKVGKENLNTTNVSGTSFNVSRARPLRKSYASPNVDNSFMSTHQNVPQKSTGLVSKAMEYVFGW